MVRPTASNLATWCVVWAVTLFTNASLAQEPDDARRAEQLFDEGRALLNENRVSEACQKFAQSQELDPGGGTILNLGICRRRQGRTATAFKILGDALARAQADGRSDRVGTAQRHLAELEPELSRLTIELWLGAPPDVVVELDGQALESAQLGRALPLDPGPHRVRVSRPGHEPFEQELELGPRADARRISVSALRPSAPLVPPEPVVSPRPAPPRPAPAPALPPVSTSGPWLGYALISAGGVAVIGGGYFGLRALSLKKSSDRQFDGTHCKTQSCVDDWNDAKRAAMFSNVGIGAGLVAAGIGTYLLLRHSSHPQRANLALSVEPMPAGVQAAASAEF